MSSVWKWFFSYILSNFLVVYSERQIPVTLSEWTSILFYTVIGGGVKDELEHKEASTGNKKVEKAVAVCRREKKPLNQQRQWE